MICQPHSFNPRTHTGCDLYDGSICNLVDLVSIHAPTRGATLQITLSNIRQGRFNPRTHTGCDIVKIKFAVRTFSFNPRTHTGCDTEKRVPLRICRVSIHAPTRGATGEILTRQFHTIVSIHAPTRGATIGRSWRSKRLEVSIHAPTRGATCAA